jgi:nucleotide-binding universal stress UspA family protein
MQHTSSVVVGYDGSGRALSALTWAAREAADRGLPLRIIQAIPYAAAPDRRPSSAAEDCTLTGNDVLDEGIRIASTLLDGAQVRGRLVPGQPAGVLVEASDDAALVVVGQRSQDAPVSSALGSTSLILAERARCPVVVARGACGPERSTLPVVVGVTGGASSRAALDFAAHTAQLRGVALTIVAAWSLPPTRAWSRGAAGFDTIAQLARDVTARAAAVADASEKYVHDRYPSIVTRRRVEQIDAATALERASRGAALLVVGEATEADGSSRDARGIQGWGRVAQTVLGRAACPVVVVPGRAGSVDEGRFASHGVDDDAQKRTQVAR